MEVVYGHDQAVAAWVASRIPNCSGAFGQFAAIGVADSQNLVAGFVFHAYSPCRPSGGNIEITLAADNPFWLRPRIIGRLMDYPFRQIGCHRMTAIIARKNKRSRKFTEHFGFKLEGVVRQGYGNDDAMVYGLLLSEASKWLRS